MLRKTADHLHQRTQLSPASMRPQRNAAENFLDAVFPLHRIEASMRPQRNAAENFDPLCDDGELIRGFNEAAA